MRSADHAVEVSNKAKREPATISRFIMCSFVNVSESTILLSWPTRGCVYDKPRLRANLFWGSMWSRPSPDLCDMERPRESKREDGCKIHRPVCSHLPRNRIISSGNDGAGRRANKSAAVLDLICQQYERKLGSVRGRIF